MTTTTARRGRPPAVWHEGTELTRSMIGTAVLIDRAGGAHRPRLVGRIVRTAPTRIYLRDRNGIVHEVAPGRSWKWRVLPQLFEPDTLVFMTDGRRAVVIETSEERVLVETSGGRVWVPEAMLMDPDLQEVEMVPLKRGPMAADPVTEAINAAVVADRSEPDAR